MSMLRFDRFTAEAVPAPMRWDCQTAAQLEASLPAVPGEWLGTEIRHKTSAYSSGRIRQAFWRTSASPSEPCAGRPYESAAQFDGWRNNT